MQSTKKVILTVTEEDGTLLDTIEINESRPDPDDYMDDGIYLDDDEISIKEGLFEKVNESINYVKRNA